LEQEKGFYYTCIRCGECCCRPGSVFFTAEEMKKAAAMLGTTVKSFKHKYVTDKLVDVFELYTESSCPFYIEEEGCSIYEARPLQCKTYPFWKNNFTSQEALEKLHDECPGTGEGEFFSVDDIVDRLEKNQREFIFNGAKKG